jgi:hypothetical protein
MVLPEVKFIMGGERDDGYSAVYSGSENSNNDDSDSNGNGGNCDPSYPDVCIPCKPPDLNCPDISFHNFKVVGSDPHGFDGDNDGIGCDEESGGVISDQEDDELPSCQDDSRPRPSSCRDDLDRNEEPIGEGDEDAGDEDAGGDESEDFGPDGPVD